MIKGEKIKLRRKNGTETIVAEISRIHPGMFGNAFAKDATTGFEMFHLERKGIWMDTDGYLWIEIEEENE